jgi:probable F420-dependent oxidoreductase
MKFSIGLLNSQQVKAFGQPAWYREVTPAQQTQALQLADELGYWKVCVGEHYAVSEDHIDLTGKHTIHGATALAYAAGCTKRLRVASSITLLPLLHPIAQAKIWATLDWVSGGRAEMSVGVGWHEEEFEAMGVDFHKRGAICDEQLECITKLWTGEVMSFEGEFYQFKDMAAEPIPVQKPGLPIWFGGDAPAQLRRVARFGSGWHPFQTPLEEVPVGLDKIRSHKDFHGQPIDVAFWMMNLKVGPGHTIRDAPDADGRWDAAYTVDLCGRLSEMGVTETRLQPPELKDFEAYLDWLRWAAEEVMPKS